MAARPVPGKSALFVCDVQDRFRTAIHGFDHVMAMSAKMVKAARILGDVKVYATEQNPKALGSTVAELGLDQLDASVQPLGSPLAKTRFSMVLPEVTKSLKEHDIKSVLVVGIETTLDLLKDGYDVWVLADAVSSCNAEERSIAFNRLRTAGASITTTESILFELMVDASHPQFRAISGLIKEEKATTKAALQALAVS